MDPRVIDIPKVPRWFLVNGIIGPFRSPRSAEAYQKIWTAEGSPLWVYSQKLAVALQDKMGSEYCVKLAMRYGKPSIQEAFDFFSKKEMTQLTIVPLYPHYASSSWGSSVEKVFEILKKQEGVPFIKIIEPFYDHPAFIKAIVSKIYESVFPVGVNNHSSLQFDHILLSYHGLPERQIRKADITAQHCLHKTDCCEIKTPDFCYKAQCYATSRALIHEMNWTPENVTTCFQSRLGRTPWIQPFTDHVIEDLARQGKKRLLVVTPSFVADCLETLEEMGIRNRELFIKNGGEDYFLVPCVNESELWVEALEEIVRDK